MSVELFRSASRVSIASKGVDLRIEELKSQNRQLLEELFALRKSCESKEEELTELRKKVQCIDVNKRMYLRTVKQCSETVQAFKQWGEKDRQHAKENISSADRGGGGWGDEQGTVQS